MIYSMNDKDIDLEFVKRIAEGANQISIKPADRLIIRLAIFYSEVNLQFLKEEVPHNFGKLLLLNERNLKFPQKFQQILDLILSPLLRRFSDIFVINIK